jgi:hypothetical protein
MINVLSIGWCWGETDHIWPWACYKITFAHLDFDACFHFPIFELRTLGIRSIPKQVRA